MGGLVSFLIASTIFAAVGTTVRGLLRPISWALLALALALLVANRLTGIPASDTEDIANQSSPAPAPTSDRPVALEGWQDIARELEPVYSNTLADTQDASASGTSLDAGAANRSSNDNITNDNITVSPERSVNSRARQSSSPTALGQSPSPIPGFW